MSTLRNLSSAGTTKTSAEQREHILDAFRRWGYLEANLDPLQQSLRPARHPELRLSGDAADEARAIYCGTIGAEFMHIPEVERRQWIQERLESAAQGAALDQPRILQRLVEADIFEQVLQARYLGTKRFSLEGVTALIPLLDEVLTDAIEHGAVQAVIAMSHRGRLNVIAHVVQRSPAEIFAGFEDVDPRSVLGGGDVKYHIGSTGDYTAADGRKIHIHLVSNPSHLEAVDPVALGRTRQADAHGARHRLPF
jgi:2-oxoglutarate dehydrogenase E1 component